VLSVTVFTAHVSAAELFPASATSFSQSTAQLSTCCLHTHPRHTPNSKFEVTLRLTVSMSWYRAPLWDLRPDITSCRNVAFWNLQSYFCEAPSLTRGLVCNLHCDYWLVWIAQKRNHTLLSHLRLPQPGGPDFRIYIPQEQGGPVIQLYPRTLDSLWRLAGLRWRYVTFPQPGGPGPSGTGWRSPKSKVKATLWPTASQSVCLGL
jgi:hypothetical protein